MEEKPDEYGRALSVGIFCTLSGNKKYKIEVGIRHGNFKALAFN